MLRGHESLVRLVGKRRKLHPSVLSLAANEFLQLKDGLHTKSVEVCGAEGSADSGKRRGEAGGRENCSGDWVSCPVCGKSVQGTDSVINSHLDTCLRKGPKRKCTQLTLFGLVQRISKPPTLDSSRKDNKQNDKKRSSNCTKIGTVSPSSSLSPPLKDKGALQKKDVDSQDKLYWPAGVEVSCSQRGQIYLKAELSMRSQVDHDDINSSGSDFADWLDGEAEEAEEESTKQREEGSWGSNRRDCSNELLQGVTDVLEGEFTRAETMECSISMVKQEQIRLAREDSVANKVAKVVLENVQSVQEDSSTGVPEMVCICKCHFAIGSSRVCNDLQREETSPLTENCENDRAGNTMDPLPVDAADGRELEAEAMLNEIDQATTSAAVGQIETCIVGRKFNIEAVCVEAMQIILTRELDNPKDANAIKVLTLDSMALGYLPRQIAQHLSFLLDKKLVTIKGAVGPVPEDLFKAMPVQIICETKTSALGDKEVIANCWQQVVEASLVIPLARSNSLKYQANFLCLLQVVLDRDSHLFSDDERYFLSCFKALSDDAQRLFILLYQRKGPWFRIGSLNYADVADVDSASQELISARYMVALEKLSETSEVEVREVVEILNVVELRQLVCVAQLKKKKEATAAKRDELVNWTVFGAVGTNQASAIGGCSGSAVKDILFDTVGYSIRISDDAAFLLWRLQRLFFLNGDQDLSSFLLVDMGMVKYPKYQCNRLTPVFASREALLAYEKALGVAQVMDMAVEVNDMPRIMAFLEKARTFLRLDHGSKEQPRDGCPSFLYRFTAARVYAMVCTLGVSILERQHRYREAVELLKELLSGRLRSGRRGYWTVRLATDLDHLGRKEESLQVAERGVGDPWIRGGDRVALKRRVVRLGKPPRRWRKPPYAEALDMKFQEVQIRGRPLNCIAGVKSRFYGYDNQQCGVEELALQYYASEEGGGWQGMHSEGGIWMTLFGLLMWEILFAPIPDVFQTPFQTAPLDLDTESFYTARQPLIETRLQAIYQGKAIEILAQSWSKYHGTFCRGVNWERYNLEKLQTIATCIGGPGLGAVCRLLAEDHAGYTAGMPDLLLWRTYLVRTISARSSSDKDCPDCSCSPPTSTEKENRTKASCIDSDNVMVQGQNVEYYNKERNIVQGEAKLVEVKGPRDRLSEQQRAWITVLLNAGLSVEVCKVLENLESN